MNVTMRRETTTARIEVEAPALVPAAPKPILPERRGCQGDGRCPHRPTFFRATSIPASCTSWKLLGFHKMKVESAEGMFYTDQNGRKILDSFLRRFRLAGLRPQPFRASSRPRKRFSRREPPRESPSAFMSQYASALAYNLGAVLAGEISTWCSSARRAPEAMEAAIKVAERRRQGPSGAERSSMPKTPFHGKDQGRAVDHRRPALSAASSSWSTTRCACPFRRHQGGRERLPLRSRNRRHRAERPSRVAGGASYPRRAEYWQKLRELCDRFGVVVGRRRGAVAALGRTGHFSTPSSSTAWCPTSRRLPKSLGGGKAAGRRDDRAIRRST